MKKNKFFALAASLLALGFGLVGCESGDGEDSYNAEKPTTWKKLEGTATTSVTAKWTFATDTLPIGTAEASVEGKEIPADSGEGAKLVGGNGYGIKWVEPTGEVTDDTGASTGRIQASNKTASLATPENGAMLLLTTTADTNITVRAKGAGAATSARIVLIRKQGSEENLVYKDNLYSAGSKFIAFHLKNAPAGTYEIYFNGSTISEIDCNSSTTVTEPKAYSSNDDLTLSAAPTTSLTALVDTHTFTLSDADGDVTASASWSIVKGSDIATVSAGKVSAKTAKGGDVTVRARIGRFYKDADLTFVDCENQIVTILAANNLPTAVIYAHEKAETDTTPVTLTDAEKTAFWANESVTNAFTPVVLGKDLGIASTDVATVTLEDFGYDKEMPLGLNVKATAGAAGGKFGLSWKDGKNGVCSTDGGKGNIDTNGWKLATITYKVTASAARKLVKAEATSANGKNANDTILKLVVGSEDAIPMKADASATKNAETYTTGEQSKNVSGETTIKVEVWTCRNGNSFSLQDVKLFFAD